MSRAKIFKQIDASNLYDGYVCNFTLIKDYAYVAILYIGNKIITFMYWVYAASKIYVLWILLHYFASHLYVYYCVPKTLIGFLVSPFLIASPQCHSLRWVVYNGANIISNMWVILGTWLCSIMITNFGVTHDTP
jgi:hypothetical protein